MKSMEWANCSLGKGTTFPPHGLLLTIKKMWGGIASDVCDLLKEVITSYHLSSIKV